MRSVFTGLVLFWTLSASGQAGESSVVPRPASDRPAAGLFYGAVTLWQLLTAEPGAGPVTLAARTIDDAPRFAWRGLMLDSSRHFQSTAYIKHFIDWMAELKLNLFHWHLTDDQGWRLEIKHYPKLTGIGAWSVPAGQAPAADIDPATGKPRLSGGFYTQDEVRNIVAYAAARHITILPEIEMPGHAAAAIAAYPELGTEPVPGGRPSSDWGVNYQLYNIDDGTFTFLETVLTEVMTLFPSPYIHIGGDEAVRAGHDTILSPAPTLYFDNRQGGSPNEPPGRGKIIALPDVYGYDPMPAGLTPAEAKHVLGVQANLWTETVRTEDQATRMTYPRAAALAEIAWTDHDRIDWQDFQPRLATERQRYARLGLQDDQPAPNADPHRLSSQELQMCRGSTHPLNLEYRPAPPHSPDGELEVHADGCTGDPIALLPLTPAINTVLTTRLSAALPGLSGKHDLCLRFTAKRRDPLWVIEWISLEPKP